MPPSRMYGVAIWELKKVCVVMSDDFDDDEQRRAEIREKIYLLVGWVSCGVIPALIAENLNLLVLPFGFLPIMAILYFLVREENSVMVLAGFVWLATILSSTFVSIL